jgi:NADPH:quinone reductase-like Zn-dependent oxidoreductase
MSIPERMRAVVLTGHGGLDKLEYRDDVPVPVPAPGEVLIRVAACGMNNTDINTRTAWYSEPVTSGITQTGGTEGFSKIRSEAGSWGREAVRFPLIQGCDVVGRVAQVGPGVPQSWLGERVMVDAWLHHLESPDDLAKARYFGSECDGGFAEYTKIRQENVYSIHSPFSDAELASMPCVFVTAEHQMVRTRVAAGETVVVAGASGGVGSAVIQLAKNRGAYVIAVTSRDKIDAVRAIGPHAVVGREEDNLAEAIRAAAPDGTVHVACDVVGGRIFPQLIRALAPGGRYVSSGAISGPLAELDLRLLIYRDLELYGSTVVRQGTFARVLSYIEDGAVRPVLSKTFPLAEIREAQAEFLKKSFVGKLVLVP